MTRLHRLPDDGQREPVVRRGAGMLVEGVDQFHDGADGRIEVKTVLDVGSDLSDGLVGLPSQGLEIALQGFTPGKGGHIAQIVEIIRDDPPGPAEEPERAVDALIAPLEVLFRAATRRDRRSGRCRRRRP